MGKYNKNMTKNVMWNTVGSVYYSLCQWVMTVVIVYLTSDYGTIGVLGLAMTVTNTFTAISSFGMRNYQISDVNGQFTNEQYIMSRRISALGAFAGCVVYSIVIGSTTTEIICIIIYMLLRLIESTEDVYQGILQMNMRYDIIGKSYILRGSLQIALFVAVFVLTERLDVTFAAMFVSNLLVYLFYDKRLSFKLFSLGKIAWNNAIWKLYGICAFLVIYNFANNSLATVVRVSIKDMLGVDALGVYSTVASPTVIVQLLGQVIFIPFVPVFAELYNNGQKLEFKKYIIKIMAILAVCFVVINLAGIFLGEWGLTILYNADLAKNVDLLLPLLWCTFFAAALWLFAGMLIAIRKIKYLLFGAVLVFLLNLVLNKPLIRAFGMNGASYSQIIAEFALIVFFVIAVFIEISKIKEQSEEK